MTEHAPTICAHCGLPVRYERDAWPEPGWRHFVEGVPLWRCDAARAIKEGGHWDVSAPSTHATPEPGTLTVKFDVDTSGIDAALESDPRVEHAAQIAADVLAQQPDGHGFHGTLSPRILSALTAAALRGLTEQQPSTLSSPPAEDVRPWRAEDGDTRCQKCGTRNPVWWADNKQWNATVGGPDATDDPGGILCPTCYHALWLGREVALHSSPEVRPYGKVTDADAERTHVERFADLAADQFRSDMGYGGAEVKRRILTLAHVAAPDHPHTMADCPVCRDDEKLDR